MKLFDESVNVPLRYHVAITGRGPFGPLPRLEYTLDLADMRGTAGAPQGSLHDVATAIGKLETDRHRRLSPEDGPAARAVTAAAARTR